MTKFEDDPVGWAAEVAAKGAAEAFEATSDWHSAKHDVRIALLQAPNQTWPARFVRKGWGTSPIVAVMPAINDEIADALDAWLDEQPQPRWVKEHMMQRVRSVKARADGLILLDEHLSIIVLDPTDPREASSRRFDAFERRSRSEQRSTWEARRAGQIAREAAIKAEMPTEQADAFLVEALGYGAEEVIAWAASTRRPRRRAARGMIGAANRGDVAAVRRAGAEITGADWRARVDGFISRMTSLADD